MLTNAAVVEVPHAELGKTPLDLVKDIEKLRTHLGIEQWVVFGGSWGVPIVGLQSNPSRKLHWTNFARHVETQGCAGFIKKVLATSSPENYVKPIPPAERHDIIAAYYKRLTSPELQTRLEAARAWSIWEASTSRLLLDPELMQKFGESQFADAFARIECHYFVNKGFFRKSNC